MGDVGGNFEDRSGINFGDRSQADRGYRDQHRAGGRAQQELNQIYQDILGFTEPYRQAGNEAIGMMQSDDFQRDFTIGDFQKDPGFQFRMDEGMKALQNSASAKGKLNSGGTMKDIMRFSQNFASNEYQNAYDRFNADRDRRFARLGDLAGRGQFAVGQAGNAGQNFANKYADIEVGIGNASAAKNIAQANRMNQFGDRNEDMLMEGMGMMFSDERLKTDIESISKEDLAELRAVIKPYAFKYRDKKHGAGNWLGVMAQDLEKSKLGRFIVEVDENGHKKINLQKAMSVFLASLSLEVQGAY